MFRFVIRRRITKKFTPELMSLTDRYITFSLLRKIGLLFTRAFFILQILFILGNDLAKLGYLWGIAFLVEAISGYPSGVIKDRIGYRKILFLTYVILGIGYFLLSIATSYEHLIIVLCLESLGYGLDSESLQSWFDKNYAVLSQEIDPDRKIYSKIFARMSTTNDFVGLAGAILGGYMATTINNGRELGFLVQSGMMFILAIIFGIGVKEYYKPIQTTKLKHQFITPFIDGIKFVFTNPMILILSAGLVIDIIVESFWLYFLMIPIFYSYTGSEFYISLLSFAIFGTTFIYLTRKSKKWTKLDPQKWLPIIFLLQGVVLYGSLYLLISFQTGNNELSMTGIIVIFVAGSIASILFTLVKIFSYRLLLDNIPNDKRNAYYSLLPTLALIIVSILNFYFGMLIDVHGFDFALLGLIGLRFIGASFIFIVLTFFGLSKITGLRIYEEEIPLIFDSSLDMLQNSFLKFKPTDWYISETSKIVWMKLLNVAKRDGNVSNDEINLLTRIMVGVKDYLDLLETVLEDQVITDQEANTLLEYRNKIIEMAKEEAMKDDLITIDEEEIISKLSHILTELEKVEKIAYTE